MVSYRILLVGGGSGGHVYPLIAVAKALEVEAQSKGVQVELEMLGEGEFAQKAATEAGIAYKGIFAGKLRRYASAKTLTDIYKLPFGFFQSLWHLFWFMPDAVFVKGGYASVMPGIVAWLYFIPLYIHDSDSVPGLANKILGKLATGIFTSFASAEGFFKKNKIMRVGNPVRPELFRGNRDEALSFFKLDSARKTVLVLGGSQGSQNINNHVLESLVILLQNHQVIHQCGGAQLNVVKTEIDRLVKEGKGEYGTLITERYRVYPFLSEKEMALAYAVADVVVSRGGAGEIFELAQLGKPAIVIPIHESANGHQLKNALEFSKHGAVLIEEPNLTSHILVSQIDDLLKRGRAQDVGQHIKTFATPQAAGQIAQRLLQPSLASKTVFAALGIIVALVVVSWVGTSAVSNYAATWSSSFAKTIFGK